MMEELKLKETCTFVLKNTDPRKHIRVKIFSHNLLGEEELSLLNGLTLDEAGSIAKMKQWLLMNLGEEE